jgi:hypothetical protein
VAGCCGCVLQVCARLGLVSLGYLWHQPQEQLLADMIANDIEAILVKVRPHVAQHAAGSDNPPELRSTVCFVARVTQSYPCELMVQISR